MNWSRLFHNLLLLVVIVIAPTPAPSDATTADESNPASPARILILGDSISIGYTPYVREMLKGQAVVFRPMRNEKAPENCAGTTYGITRIDEWLKIDGGNFDVIHFNWGLHDLKRVDAKTRRNSNQASDPHQADPETYKKQLAEIVAKLRQTKAKLIFATTTPVPEGGVKPHRDPEDVVKYNQLATTLMQDNDIAIDDLYTAANQKLGEIQRPVNVHFTPAGSKWLASQVVNSIQQALSEK
jgi:acyl-CoA thioesterase-1